MSDNTFYMVSGAASLTLGGVAIGGVDENGIRLQLKASYERLGKNNAYGGVTDIMQHLEGAIIEFDVLEVDIAKIAYALGDNVTDSGTPSTTPNTASVNFGYKKITAKALIISTVGPEYAGFSSARTITASRVVPTPETYEMIFGLGKKQTTKFRFEVLEAASGSDILISDAWTVGG